MEGVLKEERALSRGTWEGRCEGERAGRGPGMEVPPVTSPPLSAGRTQLMAIKYCNSVRWESKVRIWGEALLCSIRVLQEIESIAYIETEREISKLAYVTDIGKSEVLRAACWAEIRITPDAAILTPNSTGQQPGHLGRLSSLRS